MHKLNKVYTKPSFKMISLGIKYTYTIIIEHEALNILIDKLTTSNKLKSKEINEIIQRIDIITNQN